ncbi:hypothetical protein KKB18_01405 [bacterium]|nr:hypothetical protein [bacterium]
MVFVETLKIYAKTGIFLTIICDFEKGTNLYVGFWDLHDQLTNHTGFYIVIYVKIDDGD